jgi:acyl-CoA reductase-like NAD-dependent aldehyde dehydrogenase
VGNPRRLALLSSLQERLRHDSRRISKPHPDPEELATRANDTDYGLAACIWTKDLTTAHNLAAQIRAGSVFVNMLPFLDPAAPWGGYGSSGWGREMGEYAIDAFTETKGIWINLAQGA